MRRKKQKRPERRTPVEGTRRVTLVRIMRNSVMCRRTGKKSLEQKPNAMCWTVCSPCTSDEPKKSRACIRVSLNAHVPFCGESPEKQMQSVRVGYREMSFRLNFFLSYLVFHVHESRLAATFPRFVASRISRLSRLSTSLLRRSFFFLSRAFPPPLPPASSRSFCQSVSLSSLRTSLLFSAEAAVRNPAADRCFLAALAASVHKAEERRRRIESRLFLFPFNVPDCFLSPAVSLSSRVFLRACACSDSYSAKSRCRSPQHHPCSFLPPLLSLKPLALFNVCALSLGI
ncbi:hypothetical protein TGRUB_230118 [Toxoplasma gondii RUB]|uniref:Uncharacterized protein n=1 Tax=Toxoplasma gondii RUB TaxID=935652 RepID=A0A086M3T4_TOXGO|nr:hypothetical protein TGRUB_230118 [Toxoplasma gondii RUB]